MYNANHGNDRQFAGLEVTKAVDLGQPELVDAIFQSGAVPPQPVVSIRAPRAGRKCAAVVLVVWFKRFLNPRLQVRTCDEGSFAHPTQQDDGFPSGRLHAKSFAEQDFLETVSV